MQRSRQQEVVRAGVITMTANVLLTLLRVGAGLFAGSTAVLADAANSGTDVVATLLVMGGTRLAAVPPDENHPYGHEKAELVAAKMVGLLVILTGVVAALGSVDALRRGSYEPVGLAAVWVSVIAVGAKEVLARFLLRVGGRLNNQALLADAANQRTDVLASGAALVGVLGSRIGYPWLDPAMGVLVAGLILRMGVGLYWRSVGELMDPAPDPSTVAKLERAVARVDGVVSVDEVKARMHGSGIYVDCKVCVDADLTVAEGHRIAGRVKHAIREDVPESLDVLVHVNPCDPNGGGANIPEIR